MRTSLYAILCIVIRLGAVLLAFGAISRVPYTIIGWDQGVSPTAVVSALSVIVLILLTACVLWIYPGVIARLAAGRNSREVFESPISPAELQWIAFSILGVYLAVGALLGLAQYLVRWVLIVSAFVQSEDDHTQLLSDVSYYVIQLAAGLLLAFGARGLTAMLRRIRGRDAASVAAADAEDAPSEPTR